MEKHLSDHIYCNGPIIFSAKDVAKQSQLFAHRAALFYTPSKNLPSEVIGEGALDVTLPIPSPDYLELLEVSPYSRPRFWVHLIQKFTGFIRWTPIRPARVIFTRYDFVKLRHDHLIMGAKALLDALKFRTTGRQDKLLLYYFGAIWDDDAQSIEADYLQKHESDPKLGRVRVQVFPLDQNDIAGLD